MPLYEYQCEQCKAIFEEHRKVNDPLPELCPKCGHQKVHKLISTTSFQLMGSGWAKDNYK